MQWLCNGDLEHCEDDATRSWFGSLRFWGRLSCAVIRVPQVLSMAQPGRFQVG